MLALVYVAVILLIISAFLTLFKSENKPKHAPTVNLEKCPEEINIPTYYPFKDGPFQMTMGLQSLDIHKWIEIDPFYRQQIDLKEKLLESNRRNDLLIYSEKAYDGAMEVLEMLIDHLPDQYPFMFQRNTTKTSIINSITDKQFSITNMKGMHPLEMAALLVQEDLVIMQLNPDTQTYNANALAVCFPSGWIPRKKFSLPLQSIHSPEVPFFKEKLGSSVDRYFLKLKTENPVQRMNWTLQVGNNLCRTDTTENQDEIVNEENVGQKVYLRTERQTLRRLPKSNAILFTIKTYIRKIDDVCLNQPAIAKRLAGAVQNWPPEMVRYKDGHQYRAPLLTYLNRIHS